MAERRRQRAQASLAEARRLLDAGEVRGAVEPLERARGDFAAELDLDGVRDVRAEAERGYQEAKEPDEPFYEQLLYASAQNVRFLSRREATRRGVAWVDPHPELDLPGRPEIRAERGVDRRAKIWLAGSASLVALAIVGVVVWFAVTFESATLVNDQKAPIFYYSCGGSESFRVIEPRERKHFKGWHLCVRLMYTIPTTPTTNGGFSCIHLHDGETARVSEAKPCG